MSLPKISVIIPVYNRADMLAEAVKSVFAQNYVNLQVIVIDDGSTDNWKAAIAQYPVEIIEIPHSGMPGRVRNAGISRAEGEYIAFLDSDDLWLEGKLELQLAELEKSGCRLCHTREIWDRAGTIVSQKKQRHKREGDIFSDALKKCIIGPSTALLEKLLLAEFGLFREDIEIAEDYELWLRITDRHRVCYVDKPLVRKRAGSWPQLSEKYGIIEVFRIEALQSLVDDNAFAMHNMVIAKSELAHKCAIYANGCRKRGRIEEAGKYELLAATYSR